MCRILQILLLKMTVTDSAAVQDVEMEVDASNETENKKDQDVVAIIELREQIKQIEKAVASKESRYVKC